MIATMFVPIASLAPVGRALLWPAAAIALTALYCLAYNALSGTPENLANALAWGLLMVAPWVVAIDFGRRLAPSGIAAALGLAFVASFAGEAALNPAFDPGFAAIRRLPGLAAALAAILVWRAWERRDARTALSAAALDPATVAGCDWIEAAGNYIELHGRAGRRVLRCPLARAETVLAADFVRVHRALLVRRAAIAAHDRGGVRLHCGRRLPVGGRYRAGLAEGAGRR